MLTNFNLTAITALSRPYLASIPDITLLIIRVISLLWLFDGTLISFAWGLVLSSLLNYPVHLFLQTRYLSLPIKAIPILIKRSLIIALGCAALAVLLKTILPVDIAPWVVIVASLILITPCWIYLLYLTGHSLYAEIVPILKRIGINI
jgi:hypothetical protein